MRERFESCGLFEDYTSKLQLQRSESWKAARSVCRLDVLDWSHSAPAPEPCRASVWLAKALFACCSVARSAWSNRFH